jgi:hypothetical protein
LAVGWQRGYVMVVVVALVPPSLSLTPAR